MKTLGERVKYLRTKHRLTQRELAEKTGISRANIIKIEQNSLRVNSDFIIKLAEFFQVTTDWLLVGNQEFDSRNPRGDSEEDQIKYAFHLLEKMEGERLQRIIDFIEFELRTP